MRRETTLRRSERRFPGKAIFGRLHHRAWLWSVPLGAELRWWWTGLALSLTRVLPSEPTVPEMVMVFDRSIFQAGADLAGVSRQSTKQNKA